MTKLDALLVLPVAMLVTTNTSLYDLIYTYSLNLTPDIRIIMLHHLTIECYIT